MVDEYPTSSLYLTILVIIQWSMDLLQGHLQGGGSLRRGGDLWSLVRCPQLNRGCGVKTGRLRVGIRSIGYREVRGSQRLPGHILQLCLSL
jgi:hypothetical protein